MTVKTLKVVSAFEAGGWGWSEDGAARELIESVRTRRSRQLLCHSNAMSGQWGIVVKSKMLHVDGIVHNHLFRKIESENIIKCKAKNQLTRIFNKSSEIKYSVLKSNFHNANEMPNQLR
ncbi:hypothetical protein CDAR_285171 [Caerostris darwini]|uniref:Uncharacterized protein n=1 Tax=Caerostris darwini TaxID=1538125 RepID=A0AAV4X3H1_9ARAC|nr:hypothetical protein CDAR_285171 [Caerostris darwini]